MQAAFVDIGLDKAAFLYVGDIVSDPTFPGFSEEMDIKAGSVEGDSLEAEEDLPEPAEVPAAAEAPQQEPLPGSAEEKIAVAQAQEAAPDAPPPPVAEIPPPAPILEAAPVPAEAAAGVQTGEPAEVVDLAPEEALEDDEVDDEDEELDEADAAHAAAEEQLAAEQAQSAPAEAPATAEQKSAEAVPAPDAGARGVPAEQRPAAREGRRGRRRGGRGRRRGGESARPEQPKGERRQENGKPWQSQERRGGNGDKRNGNGKHRAQIQDLLKEGDEVLVQVVKDPIGTKGARITCHISLPGRHLVFMPTVDHVGISRRIENEKERRRLRELVDRYRPPGTGFIVRTVAENEPSEKLTADIKCLLSLWNEVGKKRENLKAPACVHPDLDLILRSIRDLFSDEVEKLVIDDRAE